MADVTGGEISAPQLATPARAGSLFEPGRNCFVVTRANRVAFPLHAADYIAAFAQAAERALASIIIIGWAFDPRVRVPGGNDGREARTLGGFLNDLVQRRHGLRVYILAWDYAMEGDERGVHPLYGTAWKPHRHVRLHYDNTSMDASQHQSIVVIDDTVAFCGGLALTRVRSDDCAAIDTARRPSQFTHGVMAVLEGDAAQVLGQLARKRWLLATGEVIARPTCLSDSWPASLASDIDNVSIAVVRTMPAVAGEAPVREVETLFLDMIAAAKRYVYIETDYMTSGRIGAALAARLAEVQGPEIVLVTRQSTEGWLDERAVAELRARVLARLASADVHRRFQAYSCDGQGSERKCTSRLMLIDDEWLRIGSASLTSRSMLSDSECDIALDARAEAHVTHALRTLRDRLLAAHLSVDASLVRSAFDRTQSLHATIAALRSSRTLPVLESFSTREDPVAIALTDTPEPRVSLERLIEQFSLELPSHVAGPAWGKLAVIAFVIIGLTATWRYTPVAALITAERVVAWAEQTGKVSWAPLLVMFAYTPACFVMFPRPLITLFAVIAFGPGVGFGYSIAGILCAALVTYLTGRVLPRDTVRHLAGEKLNEMTEVLRRRGVLAVFAMRIVPVAPFAIEGIVAGAVGIKVRDFAAGTVLGMAPGTLTTSVFGDQIQTALVDPDRINYWLIAAVVVFFAILIYYVRRWFAKEHRVRQASG